MTLKIIDCFNIQDYDQAKLTSIWEGCFQIKALNRKYLVPEIIQFIYQD